MSQVHGWQKLRTLGPRSAKSGCLGIEFCLNISLKSSSAKKVVNRLLQINICFSVLLATSQPSTAAEIGQQSSSQSLSGQADLQTKQTQETIPQVSLLSQALPLPSDLSPPLPEIPHGLEELPDPAELLPPPGEPGDSSQPPTDFPEDAGEVVIIRQFNIIGSSVFGDAQLEEVLQPFLNRPITFSELLKAPDAVTDLYVSEGYVTSGAFIPANQTIENGVVTIQILEGRLATISIEGTRRLRPEYIRSRINLVSGPPLNIEKLLEKLQLLQLDPVIERISAEIVATPNPGENDLVVRVQEAETFSLNTQINNYENPLLNTFHQVVEIREENLSGYADALSLAYQHAGRSNVFEIDYQAPVSPTNSTINLRYSYTNSRVLEPPLSVISPQSEAHTWGIGFRQLILETPIDTVTLSLQLQQRISQSYIQPPGLPIIPFGFPGSGATEGGFTRLTVLQFGQEWQHRTSNQLISLDSQFQLGTSWLGATSNSNPDEPSNNFLAWQGQALWLQRLNPNWLLVARAAGQLADRPLVSSELFGIGGANSVRGYRKDQILADSGVITSLELQTPIVRWPEQEAIAFLAPFIDYGYVWNQDDQALSDRNLAAIGAGLIFQINDRFNARLDYALPLINVTDVGNSWQESGFLFVINAKLF
ncbi:hemolysin activation/secretion protein [filamentous cyanobacterium CCP5]|nr:hemolysin activation/secretion protein [filamentous cyanobacterium CCP5]